MRGILKGEEAAQFDEGLAMDALWKRFLTPLAVALGCGCTTGPAPATPFSDGWVQEIHSEKRSAESRAPKDIILFHAGGEAETAIRYDARGNPHLTVGKEGNVQAEADVSHGDLDVRLKYGWGWKWKRPERSQAP
ncbi:MAG TPA: hypothetical protein PLO62_03205 [Candidatus Hydrogenedentes bacterium]|nr:hypothetical protein [Candidatus Hydrogenedentota bacterium]HOS04383.1 hypothetical protein [Candidatus Hydrogenedentota bacterium]